MSRFLSLSLLIFCLIATPLAAQSVEQRVEPAPEYEEQFRRTTGWTGADGTYSYTHPTYGTLWSFSDTFFGDVHDGGRDPDFRFENNSHVLQKSEALQFLKATTFVPPDGVGWFWMWDGFLRGDEFDVLLGQFDKDTSNGFGFKQVGLWHARSSLHPKANRIVTSEYTPLPFFQRAGNQSITFGTAVYNEGAWDYVLGVLDEGLQRSAVLARVPKGRLNTPGTWRFFDGTAWSKSVWDSKPLFEEASMEVSLHRTRDGGYLYVGSVGTGGRVVSRYSSSLTGPWGEAHEIHRAPEVKGSVIMYNAKAHPHLSKDGRLLISYNVNSMDLEEVVEDADIYRPRFFWWTPPVQGWLP